MPAPSCHCTAARVDGARKGEGQACRARLDGEAPSEGGEDPLKGEVDKGERETEAALLHLVGWLAGWLAGWFE